MRRWIVAAVAALLVTSTAARGGDPAPTKPMTWPVDVVVADEEGNAVEGARVEAFADRPVPPRTDGREVPPAEFLDPGRKPPVPDAAATTDASGVAHVDGLTFGRSVLVVTRPGFAPRRGTVTAPGTDGPVRFELLRGHSLEGRVLLDDGRPVAGALVVAVSSFMYVLGFGGEASPFDPWTRTDAEGRWRFDALPEGEVVIAAAPSGTWTSRLDRLRLPGVTSYDFVLKPQRPLSGTVRDKATGDPVPGAVVDVEVSSMFTGYASAVADARGRWSIPLVPSSRSVEITASAKGWTPIEWSGEAEVGDVFVERAAAEAPPASPQSAPAWVRGIVLSPHGSPMSGIEIRRAGRHVFTVTAEDGTFVLPCDSAAKGVRVWAVAKKDDFVTEVAVPAATADAALPVVLRWPPVSVPTFRITGVVRPPAGMQLAHPRVAKELHAFGDRRETWTRASDDGRFDLESGRGPDEYRSISATADGCAITTVRRPPPDVEIRLTVGATLRGRVIVDGEPVPRASIRLRPSDWQPLRFESYQHPPVVATSSVDGSFLADRLPAGRFDLWVMDTPGFVPTRTRVELTDGVVSLSDVVLVRPLELHGVVKWPDGTPVAGASIWAKRTTGDPEYEQEGDRAWATTDAQGAFVLRGLRPGPFDVSASSDRDGGPGRAEFVRTTLSGVEAGESAAAIVVRVGATLRGRVIDERGAPVVGADVRVRPKDDVRDETRARRTVSANDGSFALPALDDGPYLLSARAPGLRTVEIGDVRADAKDLRVVLPDGLTIEGVLVDAAGAPLAGRQVESSAKDDRFPGPPREVLARTDDSGRFRLAGLDEGRTHIRVERSDEPGRSETSVPYYVDAGARDVRIVVLSQHVLVGVVREYGGQFVTGRRLPGAQVRVDVEGRTEPLVGVTDEDGTFYFGGLPWAKCTIHATLDGYEQVPPSPVWPGYLAVADDPVLRPKGGK